MKRNKLLVVLCISAGILSLLLYRAVVKTPLPQPSEARFTRQAKSVGKSSPQGQVAETTLEMENPIRGAKAAKNGNIHESAPFEDDVELSPEEKRRIFEEEMTAQIPPGKSPEEILRSSMDMDRLEKMPEEEKREIFLRSMGDGEQLTDEERRARFEESMGIK